MYIQHQLFVKIDPPGGPSHQYTRDVVTFVHRILPILRQMGVNIRVNQVYDRHLRDPRFIGALKGKGIGSLPALITSQDIYVGPTNIKNVYRGNIREYRARAARAERQPAPMEPEDELDQFYKREMGRSAWEDALDGEEEDGLGEGGNLMDKYNEMMARRERMNSGRNSRVSHTARDPTGNSSRHSSRRSGRTQNVGGVDEDQEDFERSIAQMIGDIDGSSVDQAFSGGGGDSYEDDTGVGSSQDDLMEKMYWSNQLES
jgi:hypothetical protein